MCNRILLGLILTFISFSGMSQFISLGMKGGVGFSLVNVYSKGQLIHTDHIHRLANFNGGLMLNLKVSNRWVFHSEMIFEDKGCRSIIHYDSIPDRKIYNATQRERTHNYFIQFPQTIRFLIPLSKKGKVSFYVEAGGYFAYYIMSKTIDNLFHDHTVEKVENQFNWVDLSDPHGFNTFNRFNWGATGGTGLLIPLWKGWLDVNCKYDYMIQPFCSSNINSLKTYFDVLSITVGYSLPVLKKDYK